MYTALKRLDAAIDAGEYDSVLGPDAREQVEKVALALSKIFNEALKTSYAKAKAVSKLDELPIQSRLVVLSHIGEAFVNYAVAALQESSTATDDPPSSLQQFMDLVEQLAQPATQQDSCST